MRKSALLVLLLTSCAFAAKPQPATITGDYLETRSADVYTGQCFANGEVGLAGDQAILAWHVSDGSWLGEDLAGLTVVAAVKANATLGDPYANPYPAHSVVIVDEHATPAQRQVLIEFARHMGGKLLAHIEKVVSAPINMQVLRSADHNAEDHGRAMLHAGNFAAIETRAISPKDHLCGNEETFYPPLTATTHAMPAVALTDHYDGPALGVNWTLHDKRSAFVGTFSAEGQ
jgi:hypothetical protein